MVYILHKSNIFTNFVMQSREIAKVNPPDLKLEERTKKRKPMKATLKIVFKWWKFRIELQFKF